MEVSEVVGGSGYEMYVARLQLNRFVGSRLFHSLGFMIHVHISWKVPEVWLPISEPFTT